MLRDGKTEPQVILDVMARTAQEFRESILAETLLNQQSAELKDLLSWMQVFELPVPKSAIAAIVPPTSGLELPLERAIALGLVECSRSGGETMYRLPRILMLLLDAIEDPALYQLGLDELYRLWWSEETGCNEEQGVELHRLAELAQSDEICTEIGVSLGNAWREQGRYRDAILKMENVFEIRRKLLGIEHPSVTTSLNNLAYLYNHQGWYEKAEPLYRKALEILCKLLGTEHPFVATSLNNLAYLYESQGRYEEAEPLYRQALEIRRKLLGTDHPDVATSLNNLAGLYKNQVRYEEAEPLYQQALEMRRKLLGTDHPDVAINLLTLGTLYQQQGKYPKAKDLYCQALAISHAKLGPNHPNTQNIQSWLDSLPEISEP